ncbi:MAG TPA: DUF2948 family protein [Rhizomicrobium sp.]|jgi:hypothetical protein
MKSTPTLAAEDADDLEVLSARLQDAVARVKDLVWLPKAHRFAALFNRYKWEEGRHALRVRAGLHFENVVSAKSHNIRHDPQAVLSLLAIRFTPHAADDPGGTINLLFSGGGEIRLEVECIEATLADVSGEWAARGRPAHEIEG